MKTTQWILFIASIALNAFFLTGCTSTRAGRWVQEQCYGKPCQLSQERASMPSRDHERETLVRIARLIGIPTSGKSTSDLANDICFKLDPDRFKTPPAALDQESFERLSVRLLSGEKPVLEDYQRFISDLAGKRILVMNPED